MLFPHDYPWRPPKVQMFYFPCVVFTILDKRLTVDEQDLIQIYTPMGKCA